MIKRIFLALALSFVANWAGAFPATYDPDASVYFTQLSINNCATPTAIFKAAVSNYITAEKTALNWGNQDAEYLLTTTDLCTASTNLAQPQKYKLTWSGSPTPTLQNGINGDGSTIVGDTGVNQSVLTRMTQNNSHLDVWQNSSNVANALGLTGTFAGLRLSGATNRVTTLTSASANSITDTGLGTGGLYFTDRTGSSTINTGANGVLQTTGGASVSGALQAANVTLCKSNTSFCPNGVNLLWVGFGGAMNSESSHCTNVKNMLVALGVTGIGATC